MLKTLLKQQWKKPILLILLFCLMLMLQIDGSLDHQNKEKYHSYQAAYMHNHDLWQREAFFEMLNADVAQTRQVVDAIRNFIDYEGEIPEGQIDVMDILVGKQYLDYDMAVWRSQMYDQPGKLSDTVFNDSLVVSDLSNRLGNQEAFKDIIENNTEILKRAIRRGGSNVPVYEKCLSQLTQIKDDFSVTDTYHTDDLLSYLESDWYILVILALAFYSLFSSAIQQKITNIVLVSKNGMRRYALTQLFAVLVLTLGGLALYYTGAFWLYSYGDPSGVCWALPIQAINGYEEILLDLKVWQYVALSLGLKSLFCILLVSVLQCVSLFSKNNIISTLGAALVCGGLLIINKVLPETQGLLIGCCKSLFEGFCYLPIGGQLIPYSAVFAAGVVLATAFFWVLIIIVSKPIAGRWVK